MRSRESGKASDELNDYEILVTALSFKNFGIREVADHACH